MAWGLYQVVMVSEVRFVIGGTGATIGAESAPAHDWFA